jgi:hypothetical protein
MGIRLIVIGLIKSRLKDKVKDNRIWGNSWRIIIIIKGFRNNNRIKWIKWINNNNKYNKQHSIINKSNKKPNIINKPNKQHNIINKPPIHNKSALAILI